MGFSRQEYWSGLPLPSPILQATGLQTYFAKGMICIVKNKTLYPNLKFDIMILVTAVFLPGESQGRGSLVGCLYGVTQSQTRLK